MFDKIYVNQDRGQRLNFDLEKKTIIPEYVLFQKLDDEAVIINLNDQSCYGLDSLGTRVWIVLEASDTINDAQAQLLAEFDVQPDQLQEDIVELVQKLLEAELITLDDN